jgi:hypothetical protein
LPERCFTDPRLAFEEQRGPGLRFAEEIVDRGELVVPSDDRLRGDTHGELDRIARAHDLANG